MSVKRPGPVGGYRVRSPRKRGSVEHNGSNGSAWVAKYGTIIQTMVVMGMFFGGYHAFVISPLMWQLNKLDRDKLTIREQEEFKRGIHDIDAVEQAEIIRLRDRMAGKAEVAAQKDDMLERLNNLRDRITHVEQEFQGTYNVGKQIDNMQKQLDELRKQRPAHDGG